MAAICASASAADPQPIVVAEPTIEGQWPGLNADVAATAIVAGLTGDGVLEVTTDDNVGCETADCWSQRAQALGARYILSTTVNIVDRDATVRLEVYAAAGGALLASGESSCEVCANNEVREILTSAAALLRPRIVALNEQVTPLVVETTPSGAQVIVDGEVVGHSPYRGSLKPGARGIVITAPGYRPRHLERFAEPGQTQVLDVALERRADPPHSAAVVGGAGTLGLGVGLVAAGIGLVVVDGSPVQSTCDGGGPDANGRCPRMYNTKVGGIALLSVGAAAVVTGAVLVIVGRNRARRRATSIVAGPIGLQGRF